MREPSSGKLNRTATFYSISHEPTGESDLKTNGVELFTVWSAVEVIGGLVFWENIQTSDAVTHRIIVRYVKDKTRPQDLKRITCIRCDGQLFRVKRATDMNNGHRFTCLECEVLNA